jgi:hypothetical protein
VLTQPERASIAAAVIWSVRASGRPSSQSAMTFPIGLRCCWGQPLDRGRTISVTYVRRVGLARKNVVLSTPRPLVDSVPACEGDMRPVAPRPLATGPHHDVDRTVPQPLGSTDPGLNLAVPLKAPPDPLSLNPRHALIRKNNWLRIGDTHELNRDGNSTIMPTNPAISPQSSAE